jgi:GT2 family glycosyltransferase
VLASIVVPTYRNYDVLTRCLRAVHEHTEGDYELLVIDNGSRARGWTWAANRGLRAAEGELLVLLNDDVVVMDGWLPPLWRAFHDEPDLLAASSSDPGGDNWPLNVWCVAFTRESYRTVGGFDERYIHWQSDCDLMQRITDMGRRYQRVEESHARHLRGEAPTDEKTLATMRAWHRNDFDGREPGW